MYNAISNHIHIRPVVKINIKHVKTNNRIQIKICSAAASKVEKVETVYSELQNDKI